MEKSNNTGKLIGALLLGAAVGGVLGILFAPNKGSVTRRNLLAKSDDLTDAMEEKLKDFPDEVKKEAETVKEKVMKFSMDGHGKKH